ncbi:diguanylate cyclase [Clostridium sp.]|uniref:diguanylate cyclase n=1 Tax=Clostridium sp. TaxID=1506 RepID=UPI002FC9A91B
MELVNNRYRIIKNLKQNRLVSTYVASDIWDKNKEVQLNILNSDFVPDGLIDYYAKEYIGFINLNSENIIKNYTFNLISHIDNKRNKMKQYFYTSEYIESSINIFEFIKNMNIFEIMDVFIEICKAVNYLHLKGYVYGNLNLSNILIIGGKDQYSLKLKDLATIELEKSYFTSDNSNDSLFKSPKLLTGEKPNIATDMYSIGIILLSLLNKGPIGELNSNGTLCNIFQDLQHKLCNEDFDFLNKLIPLIDKLISINEESSYGFLRDFISDLNSSTEKNYKIFSLEDIEKLNFHTKIAGREEEINHIMESYDSITMYKPLKKIFLIQGDTGTGKTRFLEEINFLLEIKGANVYSSFSLNNLKDSSNKLWSEILRKLILEADPETIEKYESELVRFFPEVVDIKNVTPLELLDKENTKYRLLNRIAGFISDCVKSKPTLISVDNIHLADEFTLDTFTYLYTEVIKNKNIIVIFSYKDTEVSNNQKFTDFIRNIKARKDSDTISMKNLDIEQSGEMIKNMLCMPHTPMKLSTRIYSQSYGNPLFVSEVIKDFYSRKMIYVHNESGKWQIDIKSSNEYGLLDIPTSIEQALLNQLKDTDNISHEILKVISIFTNPVSVQWLSKFINISYEELDRTVQDLVHKGILCKKIGDTNYVYDINNQVLKDIVYEKIHSEEKIEKHKLASEILENEKEITATFNIDELIFHLERANIREKVKKYSIENARKMKSLKDIRAEIKNLEKALDVVEDISEKTELLIEVSILYLETDNEVLALKKLRQAEELVEITKNKKNMVDVYLKLAQILIAQNQFKKALKYLESIENKLEYFECFEAKLEYKALKTKMFFNDNFLDESAEICLEVIEECGEDFPKIKGNAYRQLAFIYSKGSKISEALELYNKAIKLYETVDYTKGILLCLNNIGGIYTDIYQDEETALSYFIKVKDLSGEYNLVASEIVGIINIAVCHAVRFDYEVAFDYYKLALEKTLKINLRMDVFYLYNDLIKVCLNMNNYAEAFRYYNLCLEELENFPDQGRDIVEFYKSSAELYDTFGDFDTSELFVNKALRFFKRGVTIEKFICVALSHIHKLRFKEKGKYNFHIKKIITTTEKFILPEYKINILCKAAIVLSDIGDYKNAKKLVLEAEKYINGTLHDEVQCRYYYAKGMIKTEINSIKTLFTALELAKKIRNTRLITKITLQIGDYYFDEENYYYSANYYIEACELIKELIVDVPEEFRLKYVNSYKFVRAFNRIKYIKNILICSEDNKCNFKVLEELRNKFEVIFYDELKELLTVDEAKEFMKNMDFVQCISEQYMSDLPKGIRNDMHILANITSDNIENIELVIKYLASRTLATRALVLIEDQRNNLNVIASINEDCNIPSNRYIFDRVKSSMEPIWISEKLTKNETDINLLSEYIKACICIPITNNSLKETSVIRDDQGKSPNSTKSIIGYLYLESDRIINNFNDEGLEKCTEYIKFLSLLIEKHQLKLAASIDKLTGALTRKYLEDALNEALDRANMHGEDFSFIMYDLDKFKSVNDRFGHQTGDEVLRKVSKVVMDNINRSASLGRYGGEEFIIILPGVGEKDVVSVAEKIRKNIEDEKILGDKAEITVSMGIVTYPIHGHTVQELIEKADQALYVAKKSGRNRCRVWDREFTNKVKPANVLSGIISGNSVQDSRNTLALVELIQLTNKNIPRKEKIYNFLGRVIEIIEAQFGSLLLVEKNKVFETLGRKSQDEEWADTILFNEDIVKSVLNNKQGVYLVDWDDIGKQDLITGLPDWNSILAVPITVQDEIKGIIYLSTSTRIKEFGVKELNFVNVLSDLIANII